MFVIPSPDGWIAPAMARSVASAQHKGKGPGGTSGSLLNMIEYSLASNVTVGFLNVLLLSFWRRSTVMSWGILFNCRSNVSC